MQNLQIEKAVDSKTEFWGICCEAGKRYSQVVGKKFHISMAALDPTDTSTSAVVSLMAEHDGSQYLLCSLKKDSILQVLLNLYFDKGENITFFLKGHGTVHLSGYYVCDTADVKNSKNSKKAPLNNLANKGGKADFTVSANVESSEEEASDESGKATVKVSPAKASPVAAKNAKGALNNKSKFPKAIVNEEESSEDDSMEEDDGIIIGNPKQKQSTSPVKKPQVQRLPEKKSKEEEESSDEDLFDDEDSEDDDEEDEDEDEEEAQQPGMKRGHSAVDLDDEEDSSDDEDSSESEEIKAGINKIKKQLQQKKLKSGASTPVQNNKGGKKSLANNEELDLNSSIGRTPMPKKLKSQSNLSEMDSFIANMKQQSKSPKKESFKSEETSTTASKTPEKSSNDLNTSAQGDSAKKKKNKKKAKGASENQNTPNKTPVKQQFSHKLPGGIEYEDIRPGNGLVAKKGKLVHVYYTGQLENNKMFDSVQQGQKPFSFKLASGQVIKGWDLGIEGMKVGGKRRLKIPPQMGYANKRTGPIPANSTLYFTVELKAVS